MNLPQGRNPISKKELINMLPDIAQPQYVVVTALQTFKHTYIMPVDACNTEDPTEGACDEVTMQAVKETGQLWLGEQIISADVVTLSKAISIFDREAAYLSGWSFDKKVQFINNWQECKDV